MFVSIFFSRWITQKTLWWQKFGYCRKFLHFLNEKGKKKPEKVYCNPIASIRKIVAGISARWGELVYNTLNPSIRRDLKKLGTRALETWFQSWLKSESNTYTKLSQKANGMELLLAALLRARTDFGVQGIFCCRLESKRNRDPSQR